MLTWRSGTEGSEPEVESSSGSCYQRFRTRAQAEAFIEDWKEAYAEVWRRAIRDGLDRGLRPCNMKINLTGILCEPCERSNWTTDANEDGLQRLDLKEEKKGPKGCLLNQNGS